jgi:DNA-binding NtrC family response regulator
MANILIVDDDPRIPVLLKELLKSEGYESVLATNGMHALELIKQEAFDLIITDLRMPHMNGMELLREVKTLWPSIPVIMITAYASDKTAVESAKLGVFDYLAKPFKVEELIAAIDRALATGKDKTRAMDEYAGENAAIKAYLETAGGQDMKLFE